jgi:hypothetical protein
MSKRHQFIVAGVSTAGKSTFSHELVKKYLVQNISIDPIIEAFEDVYPKLGITHRAGTHEKHTKVMKNFEPFISRMLKGLKACDFVVEGFRLPIQNLHKKFPELQYFVFGFPSSTPQERLKICRKYDSDNWTNEMTNKELLSYFEFLIEESKILQKQCAKLNISFFDTSHVYWPTIKQALKQAK